MKQNEASPNYHHMMKSFTCLPQKILRAHGSIDNMTEFVLHTLCSEKCLNLSKAAYFIDNPDFDCLQGMAGFDKKEEFLKHNDAWEHPEDFTNHMKDCSFNKVVRSIKSQSLKRANGHQKDILDEVVKQLSMKNPKSFTWSNKHGNHAMVIFEHTNNAAIDEEILSILCLLGFCPVF